MKLLNLGCGNSYHKAWTNIDFISNSPHVQAHNLLKGIPYSNDTFDVVYHSHVLEHFNKIDGIQFIKECWRVLKPNGIIRVAIPDLEKIVRSYIRLLDGALVGDQQAQVNYEWIMLELYDQTVRNTNGGEMLKYLTDPEIKNENFILSRLGNEAKKIIDSARGNDQISFQKKDNSLWKKLRKIDRLASWSFYKNRMIKLMGSTDEQDKALSIGNFRLQGEIHQWMYDRYSLGKLFLDTGFIDTSVKSGFESNIPSWESYRLDTIDKEVRKPDSLFMEAYKATKL